MNILAALDFSGFTEPILRAVDRIAAASPGSRVWLLHVAEPDPSFVGYDAGPPVVRDQVAAEYRREHQQLQDCVARVRGRGREASALLVQGAIADTILAEAARLDVQVIVMGSHGYGTIAELIVGGVSKVVLRKAGCPVLVIPPKLVSEG
ncbi:MAG: universal stress protein [Gemmatimonadales bacterium]|nr:universal stress protein [Gemmatimonadales bacterium]